MKALSKGIRCWNCGKQVTEPMEHDHNNIAKVLSEEEIYKLYNEGDTPPPSKR